MDYESTALPTELRAPMVSLIHFFISSRVFPSLAPPIYLRPFAESNLPGKPPVSSLLYSNKHGAISVELRTGVHTEQVTEYKIQVSPDGLRVRGL